MADRWTEQHNLQNDWSRGDLGGRDRRPTGGQQGRYDQAAGTYQERSFSAPSGGRSGYDQSQGRDAGYGDNFSDYDRSEGAASRGYGRSADWRSDDDRRVFGQRESGANYSGGGRQGSGYEGDYGRGGYAGGEQDGPYLYGGGRYDGPDYAAMGYGRGQDYGRGSGGRGGRYYGDSGRDRLWRGDTAYGSTGENPGYPRGDYGRSDYGRSDYGRSDYGRDRYAGAYGGHHAPNVRDGRGDGGRDFWDRATDEVSSWFGDRDAERRRQWDAAQRGEHRGRGPEGYRRSDGRISEDVHDRLTDDDHLDARAIKVEVKDGEVTLSGTVRSRADKRRAEDIADSVTGARHVQNNLRVEEREGSSYGSSYGASNRGDDTAPGVTAGGTTVSPKVTSVTDGEA